MLMSRQPAVIHIDDATYDEGWLLGEESYEALVNQCPVASEPLNALDASAYLPADEWDAIALNYLHNRKSQGRGLSPSRCLLECGFQCADLGHGGTSCVFVDTADVSLQRLVLSVDLGSECRDIHLPAPGA